MPVIKKVTARAVLAPLARPITTAHASIPQAPLVLVDVECGNGVIGRAYLFTYLPIALGPVRQMCVSIGEALTGKPTEPVARMAEMESMFRLLGRQGIAGMSMAGLDLALWDAAAKSRDMSVARMLGASHDAIECYDSNGIFAPDRDVEALEATLAKGFRAVKFKIGEASEQADVDVIAAIRKVTGPGIRLMIDYNQSLSAPEALRRITRFEDEGFALHWVEEPVGAEDFAGHATIRSKVRTPIQSGENWCMPEGAAMAIQAGISDHAMLDVMKIGGVTGWQKAAAMAQAVSLPVSSHIFIEASAHVLAATPDAHMLEYLDVAGFILVEPRAVVDGMIAPQGPGLGIEWDERAVQSCLA